jgi:hypothetical protein
MKSFLLLQPFLVIEEMKQKALTRITILIRAFASIAENIRFLFFDNKQRDIHSVMVC